MNDRKDIVDAEPLDQDIETAPDESGVVANVSASSIEDQLALAENIDKLIAAQNKIRMAILGLAQPGDWVLFKNGEDGKAEIGFAGAMRIGSTLGVSFTDFEARKESGTDEAGQWYRWEVECTAHFRARQVRVYGRAGSRDKFFGKVRGEYRPLHEVDEGNIKIAARRGAMKEGVKVLFGLHHLDPDFLTKNGVRLANASGYQFKSAEDKVQESQAATVSVADVRMKKGDKWTLYTVIDAEGVAYSTFNEAFAKTAKDCKEFKTMAEITFKAGKFGPEIVGIRAAERKAQ